MQRLVIAVGILCLIVFCAEIASAQATRVEGWCERGGQTVTTQGLSSSTQVQQSYGPCTISVFVNNSGGVLATIYSDMSLTPKANPFVASSDGHWFFYSANQEVDVQASGSGIASPYNIFTDYKIANASAGLSGSGTSGNIAKWNASAGLTNSIMTESGQVITVPRSGATSGELDLGSGSTAFVWGIKAPTGLGASLTFVGMPTDGTAGQCVQTDGSKNLSFGNCTATALNDPGGNGIVVRSALNTTINRSLATDANFTVTNATGVAGNPTINAGTTIALTNRINSYSAGATQNFLPSATVSGINVGGVSGDPSGPNNGDIWVDTNTGNVRVRGAGVSFTLGAAGACPTCVTSAAAMTINQPIVGSGGQGVQALGAMTNGQLIIGSTGALPVEAVPTTGTSGSDFNITTGAGSLVFNIPDTSATNRGLVTTGTQTIAGSKTFSTNPTFSANTAGSVYFAGSSGLLAQDNANFFYDSGNARLGLGLNSSFVARKFEIKDAGPNMLTLSGLTDEHRVNINSFPADSTGELITQPNVYNVVIGAADIPAGTGAANSEVHSLAGYVRIATTNGWPAGIALQTVALSHANGASAWAAEHFANVDQNGGNTWNEENDANVATGVTANQVLGTANYVAFKAAATVSSGVGVIGNSGYTAQINAIPFVVGQVGSTNSVWGVGYFTTSGSIQSPGYGLALGALVKQIGGPFTSASQLIGWETNNGTTYHIAKMDADSNGNSRLYQPLQWSGTVAYGIDGQTGTPTFSNGMIRMPYNVPLVIRNQANAADVSIFKLLTIGGSNNVLGIGSTIDGTFPLAAIAFGSTTTSTDQISYGAQDGTATNVDYGSVGNNSIIKMIRYNGVTGALTKILNTNSLGNINWVGYDASPAPTGQVASIRVLADEDFNGVNNHGTHMSFFTAAIGTASGVEQVRIGNTGILSMVTNAPIQLGSVTFINLPAEVNGYIIYCSNCTVASPCAAGGTGALAKGINGAWVCN